MLPDIDGFELAHRLRSDGVGTPILFLTARDELDDKVRGFGVGGDDYVTKPFSLAEIVLRGKAITAASRGAASPTTMPACRSPTWSWTRTPTRCGAVRPWWS